MSRIVVDEYPCEAKDCPFGEISYLENGTERCTCKCSGELCCISKSRFEWDCEDNDVDAHNEFIEEYEHDRQAYCHDHCRYLVKFENIFESYIREYDIQKHKDKESYYYW